MIVRLILDFLVGWREITNALEQTLVDNVAATVPWLAPLIPAAIAYDHMGAALGFAPWLALTGAGVVEFLGLATVATAVQFWEYNNRQDDDKAPFWTALAAAGFYLTVVITVNVLLDQTGGIERLAKALLSTLSVVGALTVAIRSQHAQRAAASARESEEDKLHRRQIAAERRAQKHELAKLALQAKISGVRAAAPEKEASGRGVSGESPEKRTVVRRFGDVPESSYPWLVEATTAAVVRRFGLDGGDPMRKARDWKARAKRALGNGHRLQQALPMGIGNREDAKGKAGRPMMTAQQPPSLPSPRAGEGEDGKS